MITLCFLSLKVNWKRYKTLITFCVVVVLVAQLTKQSLPTPKGSKFRSIIDNIYLPLTENRKDKNEEREAGKCNILLSTTKDVSSDQMICHLPIPRRLAVAIVDVVAAAVHCAHRHHSLLPKMFYLSTKPFLCLSVSRWRYGH